jgi:hypothetical protein
MNTADMPCAPLEFHLILHDVYSAGILEQLIRARNRVGLWILKVLKYRLRMTWSTGTGPSCGQTVTSTAVAGSWASRAATGSTSTITGMFTGGW